MPDLNNPVVAADAVTGARAPQVTTKRGPLPEDVLGANVRRLREDQGWSQAELAVHLRAVGLELHPSAIAKIEAVDGRAIRLNEAAALARLFGVSLDALLETPDNRRQAAMEAIQRGVTFYRVARDADEELVEALERAGIDATVFRDKSWEKLPSRERLKILVAVQNELRLTPQTTIPAAVHKSPPTET